MKLPITLPEGWLAEVDEDLGVVITGFDGAGNKGFVTVSEARRGYALGMCSVRPAKLYAGRYWRRELYAEAVAALDSAL